MTSKTLTLSAPIKPAPSKPEINRLTFRAPKFNDYFELGDPRVPIIAGDKVYWQTVQGVMRSYAERLLEKEDINYLSLLTLRDAMEVERLILGFFRESETPTVSGELPESSPST